MTVVVGHRAEEVMGAAPDATFVYNEQYAQTNTAVSLHKALLAAPPGGVLWLNGLAAPSSAKTTISITVR